MAELLELLSNKGEMEGLLSEHVAILANRPDLIKELVDQIDKTLKGSPDIKETILARIKNTDELVNMFKKINSETEKAYNSALKKVESKESEEDKKSEKFVEQAIEFADKMEEQFNKASSVYDSIVDVHEELFNSRAFTQEQLKTIRQKLNECTGNDELEKIVNAKKSTSSQKASKPKMKKAFV
ncbi:MAG: hypothetical protein HQK78_16925 [Desulfobacterales bacterium]|nr:hypothetical protein [Desulfobacterales bacterium]